MIQNMIVEMNKALLFIYFLVIYYETFTKLFLFGKLCNTNIWI